MKCNAKEYCQKLVEETEKINFKAPLNSWDIYIQGFQRNSLLLKDITNLKKYAVENKWNHDFNFNQKIFHQGLTIIVTEPDLRIVFASHNMLEMNGYLPTEVIGNKLSMFQGIDTDQVVKDKVSVVVSNKLPFEVSILNYRKMVLPIPAIFKDFRYLTENRNWLIL